jgi:hypothetical protein
MWLFQSAKKEENGTNQAINLFIAQYLSLALSLSPQFYNPTFSYFCYVSFALVASTPNRIFFFPQAPPINRSVTSFSCRIFFTFFNLQFAHDVLISWSIDVLCSVSTRELPSELRLSNRAKKLDRIFVKKGRTREDLVRKRLHCD